VNAELLDHAVRVLQYVPARCMPAAALHLRTQRELGARCSFGRFMDALRARPDLFVLLPGHSCFGDDQRAWDADELAAYEHALTAAGAAAAEVIALAERAAAATPAAVTPAPSACPATGSVTDAQTVREKLLGDVHAVVTDLLHAVAVDAELGTSVRTALGELEAARRALAGRS
jgi:hypothetical protein